VGKLLKQWSTTCIMNMFHWSIQHSQKRKATYTKRNSCKFSESRLHDINLKNKKKITRTDFWIRLKDKLSSQAEHGTNKKLRNMQLGIGMYRCPDSTHTFPMIPKPVNWKLMSSPELHLSVLPFIESSTLCGSKQ